MQRHHSPNRALIRRTGSGPLGIATLVLVSLTVACGGDLQEDEVIASPPVASATVVSATVVSTGTTTPLTWQVAPDASGSPQITYPTPQAEEQSPALDGRVRVDDPLGDVVAIDGTPQADLPAGLDMVGASLDGDGSQLMATWYLPDPSVRRFDDGSRLSWVISIWQDDEPLYQLTVELNGRDWSIYVLDAATNDRAHFRLASLYADRVEAPFPAHVLTRITRPFIWQAEVTWETPDGNVWADGAPETPASFP